MRDVQECFRITKVRYCANYDSDNRDYDDDCDYDDDNNNNNDVGDVDDVDVAYKS
jgi:hypothetical protein